MEWRQLNWQTAAFFDDTEVYQTSSFNVLYTRQRSVGQPGHCNAVGVTVRQPDCGLG